MGRGLTRWIISKKITAQEIFSGPVKMSDFDNYLFIRKKKTGLIELLIFILFKKI